MSQPQSSPATPSDLSQSTEAVKLNSSTSLSSSSSSTPKTGLNSPRNSAPASTQPPAAPPAIITPNLDSKEAFLQFCEQYAPYLQYSTLFERELSTTVDMIEGLTSRTDENGLLMDPLSTTTANRAQTLIPLLKERASGLPATFLTIDKLQELIDKLKQNVLEAQRRVDDAEQAYASSLSMTKLLGVFSRKDKTPAQDRPQGPLKVIDTKQEIAQIKADIKASSQTRTNS